MNLIIVIPAFNEEKIIKESVLRVHHYLKQNITQSTWQIIIADNKSTDLTSYIAKSLEQDYQHIKYLFVEEKGKGIAIKKAWQKFDADIYCFMDADLATDLSSLPPLVDAINQGGYDMAVGSRFMKGSQVKRSLLRKLFSFGYFVATRIIVKTKIKDLPCGFKAVNKKVVDHILPQVQNNEWFFDSELVLLAEQKNYKIKEVPVKWSEPVNRISRVQPLALSWSYFKNLRQLKKRLKNR
ncbi:glycosyltransferase [Patescibacteria group bacterium]|nr:glycosyltransferase [Patescibacteria group bacterium]